MQSNKYPLTWFVANGKRRTIRGDPLLIVAESDGSDFLLSEPVYDLWSSCKNIDEGIEGIRTQLSMLWDAYIECPESGLTDGAKELREKLRALIK